MVLLIVIGSVFAYAFMAALTFKICEFTEIGCSENYRGELDMTGVYAISVFWPLCLPFVLMIIFVRVYFVPSIEKWGENIRKRMN